MTFISFEQCLRFGTRNAASCLSLGSPSSRIHPWNISCHRMDIHGAPRDRRRGLRTNFTQHSIVLGVRRRETTADIERNGDRKEEDKRGREGERSGRNGTGRGAARGANRRVELNVRRPHFPRDPRRGGERVAVVDDVSLSARACEGRRCNIDSTLWVYE